MDDYIHIAFGVSDPNRTYCKYVATTIYSIIKHTNANIFIHILSDSSISHENIEKFMKMSEVYSFKFEIVNIPIENLKSEYNGIYCSIGTFLRFAVNELSQDKIIYLDSDVLVTCDISKLWNININDYCLAAVKDCEDTRLRYINTRFYKKRGIDHIEYFNAGVIVFNCKKINQEMNLYRTAIKVLNENKKFNFYDQDVLNKIFRNKVKYLTDKFNYMIASDHDYNILQGDAINHYSGIVKPWSTQNPNLIKIYYDFMKYTPWGNSIELMTLNLSEHIVNQKKYHGFKWFILYSDFPSMKFRVLCFFKSVLPNMITTKFFDSLMNMKLWLKFTLLG